MRAYKLKKGSMSKKVTNKKATKKLPVAKPEVKKTSRRIKAVKTGLKLGLVLGSIAFASIYFEEFSWSYRTPIILQSPVVVSRRSEVAGVMIEVTPTVTPTPTPALSVEDIIREEWGNDSELGIKLAFCESSLNPKAQSELSSATGLFQFLFNTWRETRRQMEEDMDANLRLDARESAKTAYYLYKLQGLQPWDASKACHSK